MERYHSPSEEKKEEKGGRSDIGAGRVMFKSARPDGPCVDTRHLEVHYTGHRKVKRRHTWGMFAFSGEGKCLSGGGGDVSERWWKGAGCGKKDLYLFLY